MIKGRDQGLLVLFLLLFSVLLGFLVWCFFLFVCWLGFFSKVSVSSTGVSLLAQLVEDELEAGTQNAVHPK